MEWTDDFVCPHWAKWDNLAFIITVSELGQTRFTLGLAPPSTMGRRGQPFTVDFPQSSVEQASNAIGGIVLSSMAGAICFESVAEV